MAVKRKLRMKVRPKKARNNNGENISGGSTAPTGTTKDMAGLVAPELLSKNLYGLFGTSVNPNYSVVYGDVVSTEGVQIIEPLYAYSDLMKLYMGSTILRQCVDSYVTNIESYGVNLEYIGPEGKESARAAQNEKSRLERVIGSLTSNGQTLKEAREASRRDKEILGARCFEVVEDMVGRVVHFNHIQIATVKLTTRDKEYVSVQQTDPLTGVTKVVNRRFRRFFQINAEGDKIWFKEYGDPRTINPVNGKVDNTLSIEESATSIYYDPLYTPGTPYGTPRWAGTIPTLLGAREAEMVNLNFFRDNAIPAMAVMISGGALTEESFLKIEQYIQGVRGQKSMNRIVVLEATPEGAEAAAIDGSMPAPRIDIKPMLSERQHEGLFKNYIEESERKVRSTFRLPPLYIGSAAEYNRASAFASVLTADQQIFVPERQAWDDLFYRVVLSSHAFKYWRLRSQGPGIQDPAEVARIVNSLGREGALTPNISIKIANRYLDANIQPVMEEWGDLPFSIITQYVKDDKTIKGLDIFEKDLTDALPPEDEDDAARAKEGNVIPIQKVIRRMVDEVHSGFQRQLDDALQSIADNEEAA